MRKFAEEYPDSQFVQEALAQLTWYHNVTLLDKISDKQIRLFYIKHAIEHGWSRSIMVTQIELSLHKRQGQAVTNFKDKLPSRQSDLAHYTLKDPYIFDFLFYHLQLRCFVVIELKDKDFKPEYAGKMNFYLSCVDDLVKHQTDQPSIGLILCKSKNNILAEYTLRDMTKPISLAEYRLTESLPQNLKTALPTIEELEAELAKDLGGEDE